MLNSIAAVSHEAISPVTVDSIEGREEWESLFARLVQPHFPQSWVYGEGKRAQGWRPERLVFAHGGEPVALCQVLVRRVIGLPLVARINRGPMFFAGAGDESRAGVFAALRRRWRFGRRGVLFLAPDLAAGDASNELMRSTGFVTRKLGGWGSALIDLTPTPEEIRARLTSKWRNHLNRSLRAGAELRVRDDAEGFSWLLESHARNMANKGFVGPAVSFVRHMIDSSPRDFRVFQAAITGELACGILVARFGDHAETYISWTGEVGRRAGVHHLLLWQVLVEMKRAGCRRIDLGGYTTSEKYGAYKRGMNGEEYRLAGEWLAI
jgi:hypothetical protein